MNGPAALSFAGALVALALGHVLGWILAGVLGTAAVAYALSSRRAAIVARREATVAAADLRSFWELGLPVVKVDTRPPLRDARYLEVSDAFCSLVGSPREDLLDRPYIEFVHESARPMTVRMADRIDRDGSPASDGFVNAYQAGPLHARPGSLVWLQWTPAPPAVDSTIYLVTDVTAVRKAALAAEKRARDAEKARDASARTQVALSTLPAPGLSSPLDAGPLPDAETLPPTT